MHEPTRRHLLVGGATAGLAAIAGCLGGDDADDGADDDEVDDAGDEDDNESGSPGDTDEQSAVNGTVLGDITIDNLDDQKHEVDVLVEIGGDTHAWVDYELEERTGSVELDREWPSDEGGFLVRVRLDRGPPVDIRPEQWNDPDCLNLVLVVDANGELRITGDTTSGFCDQ